MLTPVSGFLGLVVVYGCNLNLILYGFYIGLYDASAALQREMRCLILIQ